MIRHDDIRRMDDFQEVLLFCRVVLFLVGSEGGAEVTLHNIPPSLHLLRIRKKSSLSQSCDLPVVLFSVLSYNTKLRPKISLPLKNKGLTRSGYFPMPSHHHSYPCQVINHAHPPARQPSSNAIQFTFQLSCRAVSLIGWSYCHDLLASMLTRCRVYESCCRSRVNISSEET